MKRVVITGAAMTTPLGTELKVQLDRCFGGEAAFQPITLYETAGSHVRFGGEHPAPAAKDLPDRKFSKVLNRRDQVSVITTCKAMAASGVPAGSVPPHRMGLFVGVSSTHLGDLTPYGPLVAKCANLEKGTFDSRRFGAGVMEDFNPLVVLKLLMNNALCYGTIGLQIKGVNSNYMQYEVSGLRAVGEGMLAVAEGRADVVVAGGAAAQIEAFQMMEAYHLGLLADQRVPGFDPALAVRPYDRERLGTVLSEGVAYLVLEEESRALARGAHILGRLTGFGMGCDGAPDEESAPGETVEAHGPPRTAPGLTHAMARALTIAGWKASELSGVIGDGRGNVVSDRIEARTYKTLTPNTPIASVKGQFGELSETAGVVSLIVALEALRRQALPPTKNFVEADPEFKSLRLAGNAQPINGNKLAVVSRSRFGVSGALTVEGV